jgi:hypothetical protein
MVKVKSKFVCNYENCKKPAFYGQIRLESLRCIHHRENYKKCSSLCICGNAQPNYNLLGQKPAICCKNCKSEDMIDVRHGLCQCGKTRPSFNLPGNTKPICCEKCKTDKMINIVNDMCKCGKTPSFNLPGEKALYCESCKSQGMVNVKSKLCLCGKVQPNFNYPGKIGGICCSSCKKEGMVNVLSRLCLYCDKVQPSFNYPGQTIGIYCVECCEPGMINVRCKLCDCGKSQPSFNYPGQRPAICCVSCKKENMIDVHNGLCKCEKARPSFNFIDQTKPICCVSCKQEGMVSIKNRICMGIIVNGVTEPCPYRTGVRNDKYKGYCAECFRRNFPVDPLTLQIRKKTKEIAVRDFINANFEGFQHDKVLQTGHCDCSIKRRIDHRKLINGTLLVIETDENQHKSYNQMNEETRYDDLYMAFSGKWVYIRFNPDKYINKGITKNPMMETRFKKLKIEIEKQITRIEKGENTELVERIYMFYDKN